MGLGTRFKFVNLIILSFVLGGLFLLENKTQTMRLRSMIVSPPNYNIELCVWGSMGSLSERYWPLWVLDFQNVKKKVESLFPVRARWRLRGWGSVELHYESLRPEFLLLWNDVRWAVAQEELIWSSEDPLFAGLYEISPDLPVIEWSPELLAPLESAPPRNVHPALLPVREALSWVRGLRETGWLEKTSRILVERQGGRFRLRLTMSIYGAKEMTLFLPDTPRSWGILAQALESIVRDNIGGTNLTIDGTYKNKIIVK